LVLLFAGIFAGVLIISVAAGVLISRRDDTRTTERRLAIAQEQVAQLAAAYSDQETGARGFVLTGDERFLEPFNAGKDRVEGLTRSLTAIAVDEHALQQPLDRTVAAGESWRTTPALRAIAEQRAGDSADGAVLVAGESKALFDTLRSRLAALTRGGLTISPDTPKLTHRTRDPVSHCSSFSWSRSPSSGRCSHRG
jgi:CHASE3 domain sensor protein